MKRMVKLGDVIAQRATTDTEREDAPMVLGAILAGYNRAFDELGVSESVRADTAEYVKRDVDLMPLNEYNGLRSMGREQITERAYQMMLAGLSGRLKKAGAG